MKKKIAEKFVKDQLRDLDIRPEDPIYTEIYNDAVEFAEIATKKEVIQKIEDTLEFIPLHQRYNYS